VGVFIAHDPESKRITGNRVAQELVSLPADANVSKSAPERRTANHMAGDERGSAPCPSELPMQRAVRGEAVRNYEMDLVFSDGTVKSVLGNASPLLGEDDKPRGGIAC